LENLVAVLKIQIFFLSPGAGNETYFEHVYLSSYLVEGSDLLVREGYVWLKTIDQLERVDVIKRIDDQWCDPLELNKISGISELYKIVLLILQVFQF
jgi:uncharacterized circularly permuted ATP-grasp superfamily protein